jgi:murein DD-endopeptidase MepM/ murein hydrolase activator NlpD
MQPRRVKLAPHVLRLALPLGLILLAAALVLTTQSLQAFNQSPFPLAPSLRFSERITRPTESTALLRRVRVPMRFTLMRGETATQVFAKLGLQGPEAREATNALAERVDLRSLKAGNQYSAYFNPDSTLASFELVVAGSGRVEMTRAEDRWSASWEPFQRTAELRLLSARLDSSLEAAIEDAGGPTELAYRMSDVLQWDLDFNRDLRVGDHFDVLYEDILLDGSHHDVGRVFALVYDNLGRRHEAYRWDESGTYYDGDGRPMRKMFLRSPLRYSRITSRFTTRRYHPVLHTYRPHYGVDYRAQVGTPVHVTAGGEVVFAGWDGGGGKVVKVRHSGGYLTEYLHLSRFAAGIHQGARVRQGDVIAFTGATGLASGPHLDYRVKRHDGWIDPLSLKSVRAEPIPVARLASFRSWRNQVLAGFQTGVIPSLPSVPGLPGSERQAPRYAVAEPSPQPRSEAVAR